MPQFWAVRAAIPFRLLSYTRSKSDLTDKRERRRNVLLLSNKTPEPAKRTSKKHRSSNFECIENLREERRNRNRAQRSPPPLTTQGFHCWERGRGGQGCFQLLLCDLIMLPGKWNWFILDILRDLEASIGRRGAMFPWGAAWRQL